MTTSVRIDGLFRAHYGGLLRLAGLLTGSQTAAEELVQEAFVRLWQRSDWPAAGAELAYLRRTVVNLSHGRGRHLKVTRRREPMARLEDSMDLGAVADVVDRRQVDEAVRRLPWLQRSCVVLRYYCPWP